MKRTSIALLIVIISLSSVQWALAQMERINTTISRPEAESHLRILASDEMRGRNTGTIELNIAGRYVAEQFRRSGLIPLGDENDDYLQRVPLYTSAPPDQAKLTLLGQDFKIGEDLICLDGSDIVVEAPVVYLADLDAYEGNDLNGKLVVAVIRDPREAMRNNTIIDQLQDAGAAGLVRIYGPGQQIPWSRIQGFLGRSRTAIGDINEAETDKPALPNVWISDPDNVLVKKIKEAADPKATLTVSGFKKTMINTFNIVGKIEGTDPQLKKEHIVMCAHYDHVGVQSRNGTDSIYNGARDNAIGTSGVINAAKYFGLYPPKRSVVFIALTGEEKGLLGSSYYADHPRIPLDETVFALNIDNSGYTTTDVLTLLDTSRTNIDELVYQAASEVGLGVIGDRLPSQNYYERSDQVSFAKKGVPAVNFKMSMVAFDERITKYYHQPADEVGNVDLDYIYKYWRAYIRSAELIGNWDQLPYWIKGDKFEAAGNELYKR